MTKILGSTQIQELDAHTIAHEPIAPLDLMERASIAFVDWFISRYPTNRPVSVFCGTGNNGGDGLAIARLLGQRHYKVSTYVVWHTDKTTDCFDANARRLQEMGGFASIRNEAGIPGMAPGTVLVDAVFGSGLSRPAYGLAAAVIDAMNGSGETIVSVDIASGLFADRHTPGGSAVARPAQTVSFQLPKLAFLLPENAQYVGDWHCVDIGLDEGFVENAPSHFFLLDAPAAKRLLRPRPKFSHKGSFGHVLVMAGSFGKTGAAILAGMGALRAGCGLLTLYVPFCGCHAVQTVLPEAMCLPDPCEHFIASVPELSQYTAVAVGPGIGQEPPVAKALYRLLRQKRPLVLDADALNILGHERDMLRHLPENSILTPHPKEFERLAGPSANHFERLEQLRKFSLAHCVFTVLKGAHTAVASPRGEVWFNTTGNPGMATGGSGDVLTGIIVSLLAQGHCPGSAAKLGVYLHGLAGDLAARKVGEVGLTASDIAGHVGLATAGLAASR